MNKHLSSDQMPAVILGDCSLEERRHMRECPECQAELARLQGTLSLFRDSVRHWADQQCPAETPSCPAARPATPLRWVMATLGLFLAAAVPLYQNSVERQRQAQAAQDDLLFRQIDAHLSRAVPASMEPFMEWIAVETYSASDSEGEIQ